MRESTGQKKRRRRSKRRETLIIASVVLVLVVIVSVYTAELRRKEAQNESIAAALEEQIEGESERAEELADRGLFMKTVDFIRKIARERLGLVDPGESVIRPDE